MKIKTKNLLSLLTPLQAIVNDNHIVPILQSVKLDFNNGSLKATGNNLEVCCSNKDEVVCDFESSICVNFLMLLSTVKSITDSQIEITLIKGMINIKHKNGVFKFPFENSKEFPLPETQKLIKQAKINAEQFKNSIKIANKFILDDDVEVMGNVFIEIGKKVFIRSTDRNRMYEDKIKGKGDDSYILISGRASNSLFSLLGGIKKLNVLYNENQINFKFDNTEINILQSKGDFPIEMFKKIIKIPENALKIDVNISDLITSLKRVSIVSVKEKHNSIKLELSKKKLLISCKSEIASSKSEELINIKFEDKRSVGFNYKYLIEIISIFDEPQLFLDQRGCLFIKEGKKVGTLAPILLSR